MRWKLPDKRNILYIPGIIILLAALVYSSFYSFTLFHTVIELFTILVGFGVFVIAWNTRRFNDESFYLFIGVSFLFISCMDLLHTLAYKGINIFQGYDSNLPTQLWIAARYLQSITFLISPFLLNRKLKPFSVIVGYFLITTILLAGIFLGVFPDCYIEGSGLTSFKIASEYIISSIFLISAILLYRKRKEFDSTVFNWILYSSLLMIGGEIAFTFYISVFGLSNLIGHIFKFFAYAFIYRAIIETGLSKPFNLIFKQLHETLTKLEITNKELISSITERNEAIAKLQKAEGIVLASEKRYRELFNNINNGVALYQAVDDGLDFIIRDLNIAGQQIDNISKEDAINHKVTEIFPGINEMQLLDSMRRVWRTGNSEDQKETYYKDERISGWRRNFIYKLPSDEIVVIYEDITERKRLEEKTSLDSQMLTNIVDGILLYRVDDGNIVYTNRQFDELFGYAPNELIGKHVTILNSLENENYTDQTDEINKTLSINNIWQGDIYNVRKDGSNFWSHATISMFNHNKHGEVYVCVQQDITDRKQYVLELTRMSTHDSLTGLYNRAFFETEMNRFQLGRDFPISVVMADIDGLKKINDTYGHANGDLLLQRAANVLAKSFRGDDVVARIGGDEFAALLPNTDAEAVKKVLGRIKSNIKKENTAEHDFQLSISFGARTVEHGQELKIWLIQADKDMYTAKKKEK